MFRLVSVQRFGGIRWIVSALLVWMIVRFLVPLLIGAEYARLGAQILEHASSDEATSYGIAYFERAVCWIPSDPRLRRWLAHVYQLQGRDAEAITMLEYAHHLQPDSLLISYELARAYCRNGRPDRASVFYERLGLSIQRLIELADQKLWLGQPNEALEVYLDAVCYAGGNDKQWAFRIGFAAASVQDPRALGWLERAGFNPTNQMYVAGPSFLRIEAEDMHYLFEKSTDSDGQPLRNNPTYDPSIGALWWSGTAIAFIANETTSQYILRLRAQHPYPPVEYAVVINGIVFQQFTYDRADESWEERTMVVRLREGLNTIGIRLVDGSYAAEGDRNGFVDWITLMPLHDSS